MVWIIWILDSLRICLKINCGFFRLRSLLCILIIINVYVYYRKLIYMVVLIELDYKFFNLKWNYLVFVVEVCVFDYM